MSRRGAAVYAAMLLFAVMLQAFLNCFGGLYGVMPDVAAMLGIALSAVCGPWGLAFAAAGGILFDVQAAPFWCFYLLLFTAAALGGWQTVNRGHDIRLAVPEMGACYGAAKVLIPFVLALLRGCETDFYAILLRSLLPTAFFNAVTAFLLLLLIRFLSEKVFFRQERGMRVR